MGEHPARARRRIVPDQAQMQLIIGSLLGDGRIVGEPGERRLRISEPAARESYVWWKYEHLAAIAEDPPQRAQGNVAFTTITHPLFDDLADLMRDPSAPLDDLLEPLGRAVVRTDTQTGEPALLREAGSAGEGDVIRE